jgi:hypothetical protein
VSAAHRSSESPIAHSDLPKLQRWLQAVITHPQGVTAGMVSREASDLFEVQPSTCEQILTRSQALTAAERLAIYHRAYYARLIDCLRESFPVLRSTLGDEAFDEFALGYLQTYPSQSYTLAELGARFHQFLAETRPAPNETGDEPSWPDFLIELATLELAFSETFDGPGSEQVPPLHSESLANLSPEQLLTARLITSPSLRLLRFRFPVARYWSQARRESSEVPAPADCYLAVYRRDYVVRHWELSPVSYAILRSLQQGNTLLAALEAAADVSEGATANAAAFPDDLQRWFREWAAQGMLLGVELAAC